MPNNDPPLSIAIAAQQESPAALAPAWHTVVLVAGVLALSVNGSSRFSALHHGPNRLATYGATAAVELAMLGWVAFGLWLRKIPVRTLFGTMAGGLRGVALDLGIALVFWMGSLMILGTLGLVWTSVEAAMTHGQAPIHAGQPMAPSASEKQTLETLGSLAPSNGMEGACWVLLCGLAGFIEETVFRGYLLRQFTAWTRGGLVAGVVLSSLLFGAAHGYQGPRNMVLLAIFGVLFSLLAIVRRSLRAGIFAHSWHDLIAGLALALLRSHHVL